jgi:predicted XRE-type DNA-binding protein
MSESNPISIAQSSNNIFQELGFEAQEAANLQIRAQLMLDLKKLIQSNHWTIAQAAAQLNEPEDILHNLMSGAIEQFSVDQLLTLLMKAGMEIKIEIAPRVA